MSYKGQSPAGAPGQGRGFSLFKPCSQLLRLLTDMPLTASSCFQVLSLVTRSSSKLCLSRDRAHETEKRLGSLQPLEWPIFITSTSESKPHNLLSLSKGLQGQEATNAQDKGKYHNGHGPQIALSPSKALFPDICSRRRICPSLSWKYHHLL